MSPPRPGHHKQKGIIMTPREESGPVKGPGSSALSGMAGGAAIGCLAGVIISAYNPFFVDSLPLGLLLLWAFPALLGAIVWTLAYAIRRIPGGGTGSTSKWRSIRGRQVPVILFLLALIVTGLYVARHLNETAPAASGPHVLVIGIDGATWDIMDPMMEKGELPNFSAIRASGSSGVLTSVDPTLSPAVWTTIATGKLRANHGVMDFNYTQEDLSAPRIWELLEGQGMTVGIVSWLVTWPPAVRNGFMVPGWLARTSETYPPNLHFALDIILGEGLARTPREYLAYIVDAPRIGVRLSTLFEALKLVSFSKLKRPPMLDLIYRKDMLKARIYADVFCWLLANHRPDFAATVFYGTDSLAHAYWKFMDALDGPQIPSGGLEAAPSSLSQTAEGSSQGWDVSAEDAERYGDVIREYYRLVDSFVPRILALMPEETAVCVLSDHGHGPSGSDWGYLVLKVNHLIDTLGLAEVVSVASVGDWSFLSPAPGVGSEAVLQAVETLSHLTVAGKGMPLLAIGVKESATFSLRISDSVDKSDSFVTPDGSTFKVADFVDKTELSGTHRLNGVILLSGRGIKSGHRINAASIVDVTPTLLYLMDSPVGEDMDGRVIIDGFEPGFLQENPIKTVETRDGDVPLPGAAAGEEMPEAVKKRLRELGYVK